MSMSFEVAVVGGGLAGLIAAIDLAHGGARVRLFERAREPGGRALSRESDRFAFNQGPHALYNRGALRKALAKYGVATKGGSPPGGAMALWGDRLHPLPRSFSTIAAGAPLNLAERGALLAAFLALPRLDLAGWRGRSLSDFTARLPGRGRALFQALARLSTYANAPELIDAAATLARMRLAAGGVTYVDGGWRRIVEGLAARAREAGAEIRLDTGIEAIERIDGRWRLSGGLASDALVLATPPAVAASLLPDPARMQAAARAAVPTRAIALDFGLRRLPRPAPTFALGVDAPFYFSVHSAAARLAPEGGALLHAARYLAPEEPVEPAAVEGVRGLVELLQPGFEREIVHSQRFLGMAVAFATPSAARAGRMAPVVPGDAPGVFLAGDWVGEVAMLSDAAAKSAQEEAAAALDRARAPARAAA
jgi:phytoene dehydrogenase-like protein